MQSLSRDLRERVVAAWESGEGTQAQIAARFRIGKRTVERIISRWQQTGSIDPLPRGGDNRSAFNERDRAALRQMHTQEPDATLERFAARCRDELGIECSWITLSRTLRKMGLTVKKSR